MHGTAKRNIEMTRRRHAGETIAQLAKDYGLSRARVSQLILTEDIRAGQAKRVAAAAKQYTDVAMLPLDLLDVPIRVHNALRNYRTVGDVMQATDRELLGNYNFGRKSLLDLRQAIANFGK